MSARLALTGVGASAGLARGAWVLATPAPLPAPGRIEAGAAAAERERLDVLPARV